MKAQYYPWNTIIEHDCKNCKQPLTNTFQYPDFYWVERSWYYEKQKDGSSILKFYKKKK